MSVDPSSGWELERKHIFVLSSSGKPIFSRYGDEQELVTTFGLLQAVISIVMDSGDNIRSIRAGNRTIVYFMKQSLYFVSISSTNEPEVVLLKQLNFLYNQILVVLTSKVHDVFKNNPAADIRQLIGTDTMRLLSAACEMILTPIPIALDCLNSLMCPRELREEVVLYLSHTVNESNAAYGILLHKDQILSCCPNTSTELNLSTTDVLLLTHFVSNSKSLRSNDHNWVPLCMPDFNSNGYLQAYISSFSLYPEVPESGADRNSELTIILMASSADPVVFKELLRGKKYIAQTLTQPELANKLFTTVQQSKFAADRYLESCGCLHFLFKYRPLMTKPKPGESSSTNNGVGNGAASSSSGASGSNNPQPLPTQYIQSNMGFPLDDPVINECIWTHYQRLSVSIRRGCSTVESTLFPSPAPPVSSSGSSFSASGGIGASFSRKATATEELTAQFSMKNGSGGANGTASAASSVSSALSPKKSNHSASFSNLSLAGHGTLLTEAASSAAGGGGGGATGPGSSLQACTDYAMGLLSALPASDHALAYVVLETGMIIVALATFDSELYVTFPGTITSLEASTSADLLSRTLHNDAGDLFQLIL